MAVAKKVRKQGQGHACLGLFCHIPVHSDGNLFLSHSHIPLKKQTSGWGVYHVLGTGKVHGTNRSFERLGWSYMDFILPTKLQAGKDTMKLYHPAGYGNRRCLAQVAQLHRHCARAKQRSDRYGALAGRVSSASCNKTHSRKTVWGGVRAPRPRTSVATNLAEPRQFGFGWPGVCVGRCSVALHGNPAPSAKSNLKWLQLPVTCVKGVICI